jgi:branched-chain amino acid transport system permease protein
VTEFLNQLASGVASGFIYASLALALVMIYQSTNYINFAQGELATFTTYIALALLNLGFPYWGAFCLTLLIAFVLAFLIDRIVLRPVANAPVVSVVIVFVGLYIILNSISGWTFGYVTRTFPGPFPASWANRFMSSHEIGMILVTLALLTAVFLFFRFTLLGLAMRAAAQNPISSRLLGIPVTLLVALGWGFAGSIGAVAGMMAAPLVFLDPNMMSGILLYGFAAALLGGINNPIGAVPGGIIVGVAENLVGAYIVGPELKLSIALALILMVLLIKPSGLFGYTVVTRV